MASLVQCDPYIRLKQLGGDEPPIFIQHGQFYYEDSTVVDKAKLPEWAKEQVAVLTPAARKEVGLGNDKV
jgi:hypothetical protein